MELSAAVTIPCPFVFISQRWLRSTAELYLYTAICFLNWQAFMKQLTRQLTDTCVLYSFHVFPLRDWSKKKRRKGGRGKKQHNCISLMFAIVFVLNRCCQSQACLWNNLSPKPFNNQVFGHLSVKSNQIFLFFYSQFTLTHTKSGGRGGLQTWESW